MFSIPCSIQLVPLVCTNHALFCSDCINSIVHKLDTPIEQPKRHAPLLVRSGSHVSRLGREQCALLHLCRSKGERDGGGVSGQGRGGSGVGVLGLPIEVQGYVDLR